MDGANLWREEVFTDRKVGTIRRLTPVKSDGSVDASRKTIFAGETAVLTPGGSLPINFEIPAADLAGAIAGYADALQKGFNETMKELQEMRRRAASQIVIPKAGTADLLGKSPAPNPNKILIS